MALLVYKFSNYENTAEREQYRSLCKKLKSYYGKSDEICIFIANYNIYDCELDGIIIKQDAIIAVEFKNYKGEVIAVDNGEWKLSGGTIIKGGSRKTVYQQVNLNHVAIKRGFKDGNIVEPKQVRNVAALVVFHQPITLINNLSPRTQSWLHVCDEQTFMAKVQDITSKSTDLSLDDMLSIIERLNLTDEYLDKTYSNKDFFDNLQKEEPEANEITKFNISDNNYKENVVPNDPIKAEKEEELDDEISDLSRYIDQILITILKGHSYKKNIFKSELAQPLFTPHGINLTSKYVVIIEGELLKEYCKKLSKFIHRDVEALKDNIIFWQIGKQLQEPDITNIEKDKKNISNHIKRTAFRKSSTTLPHWLDCYIFDVLDAKYSPFNQRFEFNLDLNEEEVKVYLGTYFPRSYAEMFCIADNLMANKEILNIYQSQDTISICDFGCGTGGELIGLLVALSKYNMRKFIISIYDGNKYSLGILERIINQFKKIYNCDIDISVNDLTISSEQGLISIQLNKEFDFILCDKMICELISKRIITTNAYSKTAMKLSQYLSDNGLLVLLDVTTKDNNSGYFYPQLMNKQLNNFIKKSNEFATLLPLACDCENGCENMCFMQQQFEVNHSRKQKDDSRVCYRIIVHKDLKNKVLSNMPNNAVHIIHPERFSQGEDQSICEKLIGEEYIDTFNINIR